MVGECEDFLGVAKIWCLKAVTLRGWHERVFPRVSGWRQWSSWLLRLFLSRYDAPCPFLAGCDEGLV